MKIQTWHIPITENVAFKELKERLFNKGLISTVDEAEKTFHKYTEPLKVAIRLPSIIDPSADLLSRPDSSALCYVELMGEPPEETRILDLIIISEDELTGSQLLADCRSILGEQEAIRGTTREAKIAKSLEERIKEGPHGKLLTTPEFTSSLEILYDPAVRKRLRSFVDIFADSTVSVAVIEEILPSQCGLKKSEVRRLINDERLFSKRFSVGCNRCGASYLTFPTREEAQESLKHAVSRKCFRCDAEALDVIETFALREVLLIGLTQGLWLEHLVHQLVQPASVFSVAGIMLENFEIDVISVISGNVILFECKDTSFGERDFWMSVPKARAAGADTLWIVTTEPLHENVKRAIDGQKRQERFEIFISEKLADQQSIAGEISHKLGQVQSGFLTDLFTHEGELYRLPPSLRRRFLRRPPMRR